MICFAKALKFLSVEERDSQWSLGDAAWAREFVAALAFVIWQRNLKMGDFGIAKVKS